MPATIARLLMCFGVLIGTVAVYLIILISSDRWWRHDTPWVVAGVGSCFLFAGGWTLVWYRAIKWNLKRAIMTVMMLPGCMLPAALFWAIGAQWLPNNDDEFGIFLGTLAWVVAWIIGTAFVWRENVRERGERLQRLGIHAVACPDCGYNLTGLKEAKCPECGAAYTLDQLYACIAEQRAELGGD